MSAAVFLATEPGTLRIVGILLVGFTGENARKLLLTVVFILVIVGISKLLHWFAKLFLGEKIGRAHFWTKQGIRLLTAIPVVTCLLSIWFNDPTRLASAAGLVTAGLAIASQRPITAFSVGGDAPSDCVRGHNWVQMSVRFIARDHGIRRMKDAMSREILDEFDKVGLGLASGTYDIVGMPELKVRVVDSPAKGVQPIRKEV